MLVKEQLRLMKRWNVVSEKMVALTTSEWTSQSMSSLLWIADGGSRDAAITPQQRHLSKCPNDAWASRVLVGLVSLNNTSN